MQSCMHFRDMNRKRFIHAFKKLKLLVLATLSKLHNTSDDPYEIILGPSMHTASSESYFPASTYDKDALDYDGKVDTTKFPVNDASKKQKIRTCVSGLCKLDNKLEIASKQFHMCPRYILALVSVTPLKCVTTYTIWMIVISLNHMINIWLDIVNCVI